MDKQTLANGLGWFSIGLGLTELIAAEPLTEKLGLPIKPSTLRLFGLREIAAGVAILTQDKKAPGVWSRVAGDVLDLAVLGSAATSATNENRGMAAFALANVAAISALDVACGEGLRAS
jgi:hypothetical protein